MEGKSFYRLVTLKIPGIAGGGNVGTTFQFPQQNDIKYARIQAIEAYTISDLSVAQPEPVPLIADAQLAKISLLLETNDPDDINESKGKMGRFTSTSQTQKWLPLSSIHRTQNVGTPAASFVRYVQEYRDLYIIWEKSMALIAPGGLANTTDLAICIGVYYTFLDIHGKEIPRT